MLTSVLIHPPLLAALANCGHGSQILIADGNFPYATVIGPNAAVVLRPERLSDAGPCKRDVARPEGCDPCLSRRLQRLDLDAQLDFRREAHVEREI